MYKVVSKIIVQKLRPFMQKVISPAQASFIPGRQIVDNIIVAQEVLHKFRNSKGKKGFIAWKIDLSKAYDRLHCDFIYDVLWEIGIIGKLLVLIMQCIKSVRYQSILNGELTERFSPTAGIRQGDPLSSYIFVLCIEKLSHQIVTSRDRLRHSTILSALGPPLCPYRFVYGSSRATSQWVTHPGIALAPNSLNFGVPMTPKSMSSQKASC
ncbi:hypothetical protein CerSpe_047260 [Prunus speciosa]